jgi:hypothetical protein
VIEVGEKRSKYLEAGAPTHCLLPSCKKAFSSTCIRVADGRYLCSLECVDTYRKRDASDNAQTTEGAGLSKRAAQIATVCECIDQCFAFDMWCYEFARFVDEEDMVMGLHVAFDLMSVSTRLFSFVALRKLDEFLRSEKAPKSDDLIASDLGIDRDVVVGGAGLRFLTFAERGDINKRAAHLTEKLTLEDETEGDLRHIVERSRPIFARLSAELRKADAKGEAKQWSDKTDALLKYADVQAERVKSEHNARGRSEG